MMARNVKTRASAARTSGQVQGKSAVPGFDAGNEARVQRFVEGYLESLRVEQNASEHTVRGYKVDIEAYLRWCKRTGADPLTIDHRGLRAYLGELDAARYARTTINRHLSSLRGFYRWLAIQGLVEGDPASVLAGPKQSRHLPHVIQTTEMVRLLRIHSALDLEGNACEQSAADLRDQAILEFLYACGARISEAANLRLGDIDFRSKLVKLFGKGRKERIVPLHNFCIDALQAYLRDGRPRLAGSGTDDHVFLSSRGNPLSADAMRKMFKATVRAAGLDESLSPHDMRHTFATDLLDGGADLRSVQEMLGHASLSTTQIYTHMSVSRLKQVHSQAHPRA